MAHEVRDVAAQRHTESQRDHERGQLENPVRQDPGEVVPQGDIVLQIERREQAEQPRVHAQRQGGEKEKRHEAIENARNRGTQVVAEEHQRAEVPVRLLDAHVLHLLHELADHPAAQIRANQPEHQTDHGQRREGARRDVQEMGQLAAAEFVRQAVLLFQPAHKCSPSVRRALQYRKVQFCHSL